MMKELKPIEGKCFMRNEVCFGYFAQHHMELIDMDATPLQFLRYKFPTNSIQQCMAKLGRFKLNQKSAMKKIRLLSGGEKSRLAFAILTWHSPHLIIMDEPTNHLDLPTQDALVDALAKYDGALCLVSHDKHLLASVCSEFWVVGNRTLSTFETFKDAAKFCYNKCKPVDVLPREFSTVETKREAKIPEALKKLSPVEVGITKLSDNGKINKENEFHVDCERELNKGINKELTPKKILMHLKGFAPTDGSTGPINILLYDMFNEKYFTAKEYKDVDAEMFLEGYQSLVKFLVPETHIKNQVTLINIAQSCWYRHKEDNVAKATESGAFNEILETYLDLEYVTEEAVMEWRDAEKDPTAGRKHALKEVTHWVSKLKRVERTSETTRK
eukprot:UN04967